MPGVCAMTRRVWWAASLATFPLFVVGALLAVPYFFVAKVLPFCGRWISDPFLYANKRRQGWFKVGGMWVRHPSMVEIGRRTVGGCQGKKNRRVT